MKNSTDETIAKLLDWKFSAANAQSAAANNRLSPSGNHRTESGEKHDDPSGPLQTHLFYTTQAPTVPPISTCNSR